MAFDPVTYGAAKKYTDDAIASAGSEHYLGITTTALTDGASTNPIIIDGVSVTAAAGDYCIYGSKEFIFNGSAWQEYGDISAISFAGLNDVSIGNLEDGDPILWDAQKQKYVNASNASFKIVDWGDGTDAEIAAMLQAHYDGLIDVTDYWAVGDTRIIQLNDMVGPLPDEENWNRQKIALVIVAEKHNDLDTPINGHTKAAITVQTREVLNKVTVSGPSKGYGKVLPSGYKTENRVPVPYTKWSDLYIRGYLNTTFFNSISSNNLKNSIKSTAHYRHTAYNTADAERVVDKIFLPSYPEMVGTTSNSSYTPTSPTEGSQFEYYTTSSNMVKTSNNNGKPYYPTSGSLLIMEALSSTSNKYNSYYSYYPYMGINSSIPSDGSSPTSSVYDDVETAGRYFCIAPAFCL